MKNHMIVLCLIIMTLQSCIGNEGSISKDEQLISQIENNLLPKIILKGQETRGFNIIDRMEYYNVPGLSLAFMDKGKIIWAKGYGYADVDSQRKVNEETLFQAASISKPVAAMAVLKLVEEGYLDLDKDVNYYLKGWQVENNEFTAEQKVTLRRILSHSAGLTVNGFGGYSKTDTIPEMIDILNGTGAANSGRIYPDVVPGTIYRYSGGGYTIMQKLLCDITGKDFPDLMEEMVLSKAGMTSSTYWQPLPGDRIGEEAHGYRQDGTPIEGGWHIYPEMAAAGLWTTPTDLLRFASEIYNSYHGFHEGILTKNMAGQMLTPQFESHGLGPGLSGSEEYKAFGHGGANEGFKCSLFVFINTGQGVAIMTNGDNGGQLLTEILRSFSKVFDWPDNRYKPLTFEIMKLTMNDLEEYEGKYLLETDNQELVIELTAEDGYMSGIQLWDKFSFKIYPKAEDQFFGLLDGVPFEFVRDDNGEIIEATIREGSNTYEFRKLRN